MGQEGSTPIDERTPTKRLRKRNLEALAEYIKEGRAKRIVVMTGAGISTSAGIPDFRSPDTGLYANLARLNLPYAEAVFDISYFRNNPQPFYTLARELYPGKYRPTITHSFISLLHKKGLLLKLFTQNIDCLERQAGVPGDMIIEAHGSFATQRCIECKVPYPDEDMREMIRTGDVPTCQQSECEGLVKPDIVFFGEQLPEAFFSNKFVPAQSDLAIVMGTSLSVHPFATLPQLVDPEVPRLLINLEQVGDLGSRTDDVLLLGDCDSGVRKLAEACGWLEELEALWAETARDEDRAAEAQAAALAAAEASGQRTKEDKLTDEVEKLTREVEETLKLNQGHTDFVNSQLGRNVDTTEPGPPSTSVATAESYHPGAASSDTNSKVVESFVAAVESNITSQLSASSVSSVVTPTSTTVPDTGKVSKPRLPDAQWSYTASQRTADTPSSPSPSFSLFVGLAEKENLDALVRSAFTENSTLSAALAIYLPGALILKSRRAGVKLWERSSDDGGGGGGSGSESEVTPRCTLTSEFRSTEGKPVDGEITIPLSHFAPGGIAEASSPAGAVVLPFEKLAAWLEKAEPEVSELDTKIRDNWNSLLQGLK